MLTSRILPSAKSVDQHESNHHRQHDEQDIEKLICLGEKAVNFW